MTRTADDGHVLPYFGYGTLLGATAMQDYCPSAKSIGLVILDDYELGFEWFGPDENHGGCALVKRPGKQLYGVLYEMDDADWDTLTEASHVPTDFYVPRLQVTDLAGSVVEAVSLTVTSPLRDYKPYDTYLEMIIDGAATLDLPDDYRARLLEIVNGARRRDD